MSSGGVTTATMQMPPRGLIEGALRVATERFAAELSHPSGRAPDWSEFQWTMARAAAIMHGVTPLLSNIATWGEVDHWLEFATQQHHCTAKQGQRLEKLLSRIDQEARRTAVPIMALKGSALHALGLYRAGERPMADIDLLVAPHDSTQVRRILESLGFREVAEVWKHWVLERTPSPEENWPHAPYGEGANTTIKIDLHRHIAERLPVKQLDITEWVWPSELQPGINPYPSTAALMLHLLLHAAGNMANRGLRLIHIHDIALLAERMRTVDWNAFLELRISGQPVWWALPPLRLVARYYPGRVPVEVLTALGPLCPRTLRERADRQTISDVSFCMLGLHAFPALFWAISFSDKVNYMRTRVRPDRDLMLARAVVQRDSYAVGNSWRRQSPARQILHWLLARPPRQEPMFLVQAALEDQAMRAARPQRRLDASGGSVCTP